MTPNTSASGFSNAADPRTFPYTICPRILARGELMISRRAFLETVSAAVVLPAWAGQSAPPNEWGSPVFDLHFHMRPQPAANIAHLDGAGVTKANLLTRGTVTEQLA